ncbi:nuclease-related domain-containing protein [Paucisalibacillus sp. EB02]|uniref:nuclease-related domain-containing protein n=1 Tax=Paucisalibacillus sp. EB02 TaxID=1347087 RepID=UPI0004B3DC47|nr:nuclease-related domain-containing protein [Paucisalibacillus sp. EB02]
MEVKKRTPSRELQILEILYLRGNLSEEVRQHYFNLKKGYEGELLFDRILDNQLQNDCLIIKDLLLKMNNTTFQIDTLIIFQEFIKLFEVKNFEGEYTYDNDNFYKYPKYKITNPEHQLDRAETLLRQLLSNHGLHHAIKSSIVFVNPEFTLYNAPATKPFVLPSQINTLVKKLNTNQSKLTNLSKLIADKLISLHQKDSPYSKLPTYSFSQLKKGINCKSCHSISISVQGHYCYCNTCGKREKLADAVIRSTRELILLFPKEKITTSMVHEWCECISSTQRVQRILMKKFKFISNKRWSYFEYSGSGPGK